MLSNIHQIKQRHFSLLNHGLIIKQSNIHGFGAFAQNDIKKGEILGIIGGYIMTLKEMYEDLPQELQGYPFQIDSYVVIGIRDADHIDGLYCINHSCNPNAGFSGQLTIVAMRNILEGEEITTDYAMDTSDRRGIKPYKMICCCGEKNCRKIITGKDWKINRLQEKYKGYFQLYIENRINKKMLKK